MKPKYDIKEIKGNTVKIEIEDDSSENIFAVMKDLADIMLEDNEKEE